MALLGGADEIVVRALHALDHGLEARHVAVEQLARGQALLGAGLLDFLAVLVGAGKEIDVVAVEPHEARDGVGGDRLIGVADMRRAVRVGDRGGDVEGCFWPAFSTLLKDVDGRNKPGHDELRDRYQSPAASASKAKSEAGQRVRAMRHDQ